MKELLKIKIEKKRRNPKFVRDESEKRKEVPTRWRKPKGNCCKLRKCMAGHGSIVKAGYRTPKLIRGYLRSGLKTVMVSHISDIEAADAKTDIVIISSRVGIRKKLALLDACQKKNLQVLNVKDSSVLRSEIKKKQQENKTKKKSKVKSETKEKKKKDKKESTADLTEDTGEKKELDKILSKRQ